MRTVQLELPPEPDVSGSCVREGDTAVLTMRWSVFNFSLVFTSNPEGNSYYLNKAILRQTSFFKSIPAAFSDSLPTLYVVQALCSLAHGELACSPINQIQGWKTV